jgi:hypothetical protein
LNKEAIRRLPKPMKGQIYKLAYSKYKNYSKPNILLIKRIEKLRKKNKIFVITARGNDLAKSTLELIKSHSIPMDEIYHRKNINGKDEVWKTGLLKDYSRLYNHISLYEDKMENIDFIRKRLCLKKISYYLVSKNRIKKV